MKDTQSKPRPELDRLKSKTAERPDNGSRSSRGCGPSSGASKDNPHKRTNLVRHAWL